MSPLIKGLNLRESTCLAPVPAAYVLMYFIHPVLGVAPFLYFAYACVFLLLPSIYLGKLTLISDLGLSERAFLGFPITVATLFLAAWGGSRIGLGWHGALILPALALMSLVDIWRRRSPLNASDAVVIKWTAIFLTISLIICFRYFIQTAIPGEGTSVPLFGDDAFMTVMTFSVIKAMQVGTPMMEGMLGDIPFSYHILMHVNNAVAHLITGIHPLYLQVYLYPVFHWFMLAGGVLAGARRFACFTEKQSILAGCLLLYTSGFVFESHSWAQMYGYFHTYFFGLPSTIILGMLIIGYLSDKLTDLPVIYATLLFLAVSSAKGVPLLLIPLSLLPIFTYRLFKRTLTKRDIFFALGCCIVAVLLKIIEYGGTGQIILRKFNLFNSIIPTTLTFLDVSPFFLVLLMIYGFNKVYSFRIARAS